MNQSCVFCRKKVEDSPMSGQLHIVKGPVYIQGVGIMWAHNDCPEVKKRLKNPTYPNIIDYLQNWSTLKIPGRLAI